uniref:Uncharacterized protein n=1 Tax=Parascaris univalens TaxID=6257 RepID=A0A915AP04_PARUN
MVKFQYSLVNDGLWIDKWRSTVRSVRALHWLLHIVQAGRRHKYRKFKALSPGELSSIHLKHLPPTLGCDPRQPDSKEQSTVRFATRTGLAPSLDYSPTQEDFRFSPLASGSTCKRDTPKQIYDYVNSGRGSLSSCSESVRQHLYASISGSFISLVYEEVAGLGFTEDEAH